MTWRGAARCWLTAASMTALVAGMAPASAATLAVDVGGITPGGGRVYVALCQGALSGQQACRRGRAVAARAAGATVTFGDVAPGVYAVAAFQDSNGNGRLDRTGLGLPLEPYGFSGHVDPHGRPDFAAAAFTLSEPGLRVPVRLAPGLGGGAPATSPAGSP